jgi:hypothetical protein
MKFIKYTYVDSKTNVCVDKEPARNGPKHPNIKGLQFVFAAKRKYPTHVPEFFGICDDDADLTTDGCFGEISEKEFAAERQIEIESRKPYPSWNRNEIVCNDNLALLSEPWLPPVPRPDNFNVYSWNEETLSWVLFEPMLEN